MGSRCRQLGASGGQVENGKDLRRESVGLKAGTQAERTREKHMTEAGIVTISVVGILVNVEA